jgi:hypothetical protein
MDTTPNLTGMTDEEAAVEARRIIGNFAAGYRDDTPLPAYGPTPPVVQPGRPPTDPAAAAFTMKAIGVSAVIGTTGGSTALVLHTLAQVDTAQLAVGAGGTVALMLAVGAVLRKAAGVRTTHHHHYDGATVTQDHRETHTKGVWAKTNNR